ncbi:MAG TPA: HNH endonuclease [Candidatus Acidoferrum sp.]|nr:HNH endonuclease [Candidatus Acidoferrum sp.]
MNVKKVNAKLLWMQFEDVVAPRLGLSVWCRAVYSYLLRHSLVVGKFRLHFAVTNVAKDLGLSTAPVRQAVRRLDELGALRLLERTKAGHLVEMRLPEEIRALHTGEFPRAPIAGLPNGASPDAAEPPAPDIESIDFLSTWALRKTIHDRERRACFYCLRVTPANVRCLDHVVPRALSGRNSYRNLVSCCMECNFRKSDNPAPDFLRTLYRQGRLTPSELDAALQKLQDLAAGKLRPAIPGPEYLRLVSSRSRSHASRGKRVSGGCRGNRAEGSASSLPATRPPRSPRASGAASRAHSFTQSEVERALATSTQTNSLHKTSGWRGNHAPCDAAPNPPENE